MIKYVIDNLATSQLGIPAQITIFLPPYQGRQSCVLCAPAMFRSQAGYSENMAVVDDDNHVHFKPIKITRILDAFVELSEGVTTEDRIINNPSAAILDGDKVAIVTPAPGYDLINKPKEAAPKSSKPASHSEMPDPRLKQALNVSRAP